MLDNLKNIQGEKNDMQASSILSSWVENKS